MIDDNREEKLVHEGPIEGTLWSLWKRIAIDVRLKNKSIIEQL
jgi:hypothetical protein